MTHLFDPFTIKEITLRNRIGVSPMCQYSYQDGLSNDWQLAHLGARAIGGAGLVIAEATAVLPEGRITPDDVGLWSDKHAESYTKVAEFLKWNGAVAGIQIAHAGRKACTNRPWDGGNSIEQTDSRWWQAVSPSDVAYSPKYQRPHSLTIPEIENIIKAFQLAAQRALHAGFQWLEIHAAHGYLIHSFYSPLSNQRTDNYGGNFQNRIRLLREIIQQVKAVWPEKYPLTVRISGTDWVENGWQVEDSVDLARHLKNDGVDLIDCSSGGNASEAIVPLNPGYQVHISEAIKKQTGMATAAVGLITTAQFADEIVRKEQADLVLFGREMLRTPQFAIHAAKELNQSLPVPNQYLRAYRK